MDCKRCGEELIKGKNIYKNWHLPICIRCRVERVKNFKITEEERRIMNERFGIERININEFALPKEEVNV